MTSFTSPLVVTPMDNGVDWQLLEPFSYAVGSKDSLRTILVPEGFVSDFASIPAFIWRAMFWWVPPWFKYSKASILHDWLYHSHGAFEDDRYTRKQADDVFLEAMLVAWRKHAKSRYLVAYLEYYAVRGFGWLAWK